MNFFTYDNVSGNVELDKPEILLVREFAALLDNERNKCKEDETGKLHLRAFREFTYIYLAIDWSSIYSNYDELERHQEALKDARMTEKEFNDPVFREACRKYKDILESNKSIRLLNAAKEMVDKFIEYFKTCDPLERDVDTGKPIWKVKDIQVEMANLTKVHETMSLLETLVKKEIEAQSSIRGGAVEGYTPRFAK